MRKHYLKFCSKTVCLILTAFLNFTSVKSNAQQKLQITPELSKSIIDKFNIQSFKVYPVTTKEVDYYPYVDGQVNTKSYNSLLEDLARDKSDYDKYRENFVKDSISRLEILSIANSIDEYLSSNEKSDIKDKILIKAQAIADKYNIEIKGEDNSFAARHLSQYSHESNGTKTFIMHNGKKSSSKRDLEFYKNELLKLKFNQTELSYGAREYLRNKEIETKIQKTELGKVLSDKTSKKLVNVIIETPVDINTLSGEFTLSSDRYSLILEDIPNKFVKNELTNDNERYNEQNFKSELYYIIKKTNSDESYYIMSNDFLSQILNEIERKRYFDMPNTIEYKTWKSKFLSLIQSAESNVNVCKGIIAKHTYKNRFGEKLYDSSTFTSQEKVTFNKNLDTLEIKIKQIRELAENNKDFYDYYNDKATNEESAKFYHLSNFSNTTGHSY